MRVSGPGSWGPTSPRFTAGTSLFFLAFGSPPLLIQLVHYSRGHFTSLLADHHTLTSPVIAESLGSCKQLATLNLRTRCKRCSPRRTTTTAPRFELNQLASTAPAHQYENFKKGRYLNHLNTHANDQTQNTDRAVATSRCNVIPVRD